MAWRICLRWVEWLVGVHDLFVTLTACSVGRGFFSSAKKLQLFTPFSHFVRQNWFCATDWGMKLNFRCSSSKVVLNKKSSSIYKYQQKINSLSMFCQPNINFSCHQQKIYVLPIIYQLKVTRSSIQKHSINTLSTQNQHNINTCYAWSYSTFEDQTKINDKSISG